MPRRRRICDPWVLLLLVLPSAAPAESLFTGNGVLDVQITGPFNSLIRKKDDRTEMPFVLSAAGVDHAVDVRVRGKSRIRVCKFPPLRLNFSTTDAAGSMFADQDKLKLVTHCRNYDLGEVDLLQEYIAYRVLNVITDKSYRVRLLRIHYDDTDNRLTKKATNRYGFVLEPASKLAERIDGEQLRAKTVVKGKLDLDYAALVFVFQYLVGNTDWAMVHAEGVENCCHNMDLFTAESGVLLVPYDLDLSGIVNASYAYPDKSLRIRRVTQRLYRGMCMERDRLQPALRHVKSLRAEILALPGATPGLNEKDAQATRDYLEKFFVIAEDEEALLDKFEKRCIKPRVRPVKKTT